MKMSGYTGVAVATLLFITTTANAQQPDSDKVFIMTFRAAVAAAFCKDLLNNPQIITDKADQLNDEFKKAKMLCDANQVKSMAILDAYQAAQKI